MPGDASPSRLAGRGDRLNALMCCLQAEDREMS